MRKAMNNQHSDDFFKSLVEIIQEVCSRFLDFSQTVELNGYMCVEIDSKRKEVYVLRERIMRSGSVSSESYCTHVFNLPMTTSGEGLGRPGHCCVEARCVPPTNKHSVHPVDQPATRQDQGPVLIQSVAPQVQVPSRAVQALFTQTSTSVFKTTPSTIQTVTSIQPVPSKMLPGVSQTVTSQQPVPSKMLPGVSQTATSQQSVPSKMLPGFSKTATSQQSVPSKMLPGVSQIVTSQQPVPSKMLPGFSKTATLQQSVPSKMLPGFSQIVTSQKPVPSKMLPGFSQIVTSQQPVPSKMLPGFCQTVTSQQSVRSSVGAHSPQTMTSQQPFSSIMWPSSPQTVTSLQPDHSQIMAFSSQTATSQKPVPSRMMPHSTHTRTSQQQLPTGWPGSSQTATSKHPVPFRMWQGHSRIMTSDPSVNLAVQDNSTQPNLGCISAHRQQTREPPKETHKDMMNTKGPQCYSSTPDGKSQQGATQLILSNHRQTHFPAILNQQCPDKPLHVIPNDIRTECSQSMLDDIVNLVSDSLMVKMESAEQVTLSQSHVPDNTEKQSMHDICPLQAKEPVNVPALRQLHCVRPDSVHCLAPSGQEKERELKLVQDSHMQKSVTNKGHEDPTNQVYVDIDSDDDDDDIIDLDLFDDDIDYSPSMDISDAGDKSECESKGSKRALKKHMSLVEMMIKFHQNKTGKTVDLLSASPQKLDSMLLEYFRGAVKQRGGGQLSQSTMKSTLSQVRRLLRDKGYFFTVPQNILFQSVKQYIASLPKSVPKSRTFLPLDDNDIETLFQTNQLGAHSLLTLTYTMWFINTRYLALRRPAEHFNLKWGDVILKIDHQGREFLTRSVRADLVYKVYSKPETPDRCFVTLYKQFRQGRPKLALDESQPFYLKPFKQLKAVQTKFQTEALSIDCIRKIWRTMLISSGLPTNKKIGIGSYEAVTTP